MQSFSWPPEHSAALREQVTRGMSYAEAALAINARFGTAYTRLAAISRGKRMKLAAPPCPKKGPGFVPRSQRLPRAKSAKAKSAKAKSAKATSAKRIGVSRGSAAEEAKPVPPVVEVAKPPRLRSVGVSPRLVSLLDLAPGECRYPYGGDRDGEAITFCGHPCFRGSVYCAPHFHLTRGPADEAARNTAPVVLRLVEAA